MRDALGVQYTSCAARLLAWLVFLPPLNWIGNMQTHVSGAQLKQILQEQGGEPISVGLIVRGPRQSSSPLAIPSGLGGSK